MLLLLAGLPLLAAAQASLPPAPRWFKGNTHTHTTNSDGDSAPAVVTRWYQDHGYNFLVLSDHNYLTRDGSFPYQKREGFILIQGEEVTAYYQGGEKDSRHPVHVNALNLMAVIEPWSGQAAVETLQQNVARVRAAGAVPHVNHPNFGWALTAQDLRQVTGFRLLEIWNGHPLVHNEGGGDRPGAEAIWDELLTGGAVTYGIAVDDAHHFQEEFGPDRSNPGRGWLHVRARELSPGALMEALERGDFYASTGVVLRDVRVEASGLTVVVEPSRDFRYTTRFVGAGGKVLLASGALESTYRFRGDEAYVRATVTDSAGHQAWVQPVFARRSRRP